MSEDLQRLEALERKRLTLTKKLRELDAVLGQRRIYEQGRMLTEAEYHDRRKFVTQRKTECANALTEINTEIKALNRRINGETGANAHGLLVRAFAIINEIDAEDLDADELVLCEKIRAFLSGRDL